MRLPWITRYRERRDQERFTSWLETRPDIKRKAEAAARDLAEHGSLTLDQAAARLRKIR
jgi:hypothetical protein